MSIEENKAIARRFVQVWGKESLDVIDELAAPSLSVQYPALPQIIRGNKMFRQVMESFRSATNKKVRWTGITVYKIVDRKVVQERGEEDFLGFLRQIGAAPRSRTNT